MNKEFIPYEQALELRYIGYNYESSYYWTKGYDGFYINYGEYNYTNNHWMFNADDGKNRHLLCIAPLYQQAFRWFRKNYNMHFMCQQFTDGHWRTTYDWGIFNSYEEAELACLKKLIEIVKTNNEPILHNNNSSSTKGV